MLHIKTVIMKNFMSVGAVSQIVNLDKSGLTLVLGENLDMGGSGARNGVGKCLDINTVVKLRNTRTNEIFEITVGELYEATRAKSNSKA